jgi:hypothetical protein
VDIGVISRQQDGWDVKLTAHLHLVPEFEMSAVLPIFPNIPSLCGKEKLCFTEYKYFDINFNNNPVLY